MKKILTLVLVLLTCLLVTGCEDFWNSGKKDPVALATPVVSVSEEGLASWEAIEHASGYIYKVNEGAEKLTTAVSLQLLPGESIVVKAKGDGTNYLDSEYSLAVTYTVTVKVGLPTPKTGFYMRDADVLQDGNTRYLVYTTNKTVAEEDNVIAIRKGDLTDEGWVYGEEVVVLEGSLEGWDLYLGSASVTKGTFGLAGETYNYLMAYQATSDDSGLASSIGLAVAKEIQGEWVKVGNEPVIKYNAELFGKNMNGCYAPSVVNYNKQSGVRIFYTYADAYGHFAYFFDIDCANLDNVDGVGAMITNAGNLQGGDLVLMFPNADMVYDSVNRIFYAVKDFSPSAASKPNFADEFEVCHIAEDELYTTDSGEGWVSDFYMDYMDLSAGEYERAYSGCIVSDVYGHKLEGGIEVIYNTCDTGDNYLHTQRFMSYIAE